MSREITNREPETGCGQVRTPEDLGRLSRMARKLKGLTLEDIYASTSLSTRFLSEFERGKPNASLGRVLRTLAALGLDVIIVPRAHTASALQHLAQRIKQAGPGK